MDKLDQLMEAAVTFRDERDWKQFHNPKELGIGLSIEASEFLDHMRFRSGEDLVRYVETHKEQISDELADVLYFVLLISHDLGIDLLEAQQNKLQKTALKYPIEKAKGNPTKYTEYDK